MTGMALAGLKEQESEVKDTKEWIDNKLFVNNKKYKPKIMYNEISILRLQKTY